MKKILLFIASFLMLMLLCIYAFVFIQTRPLNKADDRDVRVEIPSGMSVTQISKLLKEEKLIKNARLFYFSVRFPALNSFLFFKEPASSGLVLKSGIYRLKPSMDFSEIQKELSSGQQEFIVISLPEGLTISKIAAILENNKICSAYDFISFCHDTSSDIFSDFKISGESLEGYLFPDTYYFTSGMSAQAAARIMVENFFEKIKEVDGLAEKSPSELFEILTLASIVEREYRIADEAPLIASVFKNRIRRNIGLYSCATVEYIITEIQGKPHPKRILLDDLKIDNPYNTYKWAGLTPGPISNPGLIALDAAANTPKTDYYFFQIADQGAGRHVFSTTFEQHKVNHNLYTKD
ncbi:endolytic transglycosylase MltG [Treponema sp. C6A8]|uniref:endolytic transglycosylase MltG n=1 Tax=Treponema sp. C6A8 TaxID=1410609 RepID=UPI0004898E39|nr:endolytic transglycosylase MltG [Treponema sp. C6A8]